jgi:hypothetical protein
MKDIGFKIDFNPEDGYMEFTFLIDGKEAKTRCKLSSAGRDSVHSEVYTDHK